jgi:hypothetical protein
MQKYWFQKRLMRRSPINWQGWALFAFAIGLLVDTAIGAPKSPVVVTIISGILVVSSYWLMRVKSAPDGEVFTKTKLSVILLGCLVGLVAAQIIYFAIANAETWYHHA